VPAVPAIERCAQSLPVAIAEFRPPEHLAHRTRSLDAGLRPPTDLLAFELGERGEGRQQDVADEFVFRRQVLLGERPKCNAMRGEALQMPDGRGHPFPAEPIE
jgi:hypothetical protein